VSFAPSLPSGYRDTPAPAFPWYCTSLLNRVCDFYWERRLGIRTTGGAPSPHPDAHRYGFLAYHTYFSIFDSLRLKPSDVVADLGCGKGRVTFVAAQYRIAESVGVEIDAALTKIARANEQRLRLRSAPIRIVQQSAVDFDYDRVTTIVMFHPFGADTLRTVLQRVEASVDQHPRRLTIAYCNPLFSGVLAGCSWLRLYDAWTPTTWSRIKFPVHFYRTVAT
jgi:SAM-dependent methyltransferase